MCGCVGVCMRGCVEDEMWLQLISKMGDGWGGWVGWKGLGSLGGMV